MSEEILSRFDGLDPLGAERLASRLGVEFHPIACERASRELCTHIHPKDREAALVIWGSERRIASALEYSTQGNYLGQAYVSSGGTPVGAENVVEEIRAAEAARDEIARDAEAAASNQSIDPVPALAAVKERL